MTMDAIRIETLPTTAKSLLNTKVPETTDISKEKDDDILFIDEIDEDDEIRLRLSDDEEIEQDNTSGNTESQQANSQLKKNDLEFDVHIAVASKETLKVHQKELVIKRDSPETKSATIIKEDESSGNSSLDEKTINEIDSVNDKDSTMSESEKIPQLMQNPPKYWSNNFDKKWNGMNSSRGRQNFSHRNSNNWYNQQYTEKDKFNSKNNVNNHNNYFNRLRSNARENYNNPSKENCTKDINKEENHESLKNNIPSTENSSNINHSIQENGICNETQIKENNSSIKNDKLVSENVKILVKETKISDANSNQKKKDSVSNEVTSSDQECKKKTDSSSEILNNEKMKSNEEIIDSKDSNDDALPLNQDCDVLMTELEENHDSKSEKINEQYETTTCIDIIETISNEIELNTKEDSLNNELTIEVKTKNTEIASQNGDISEESKSINNKRFSNIGDKNSNSNNKNSVAINKVFIKEVNENNDKNSSETIQTEEKVTNNKCSELEQKTKSASKYSDKKLIDDVRDEDSNHDNKKNAINTDDKINEDMDIETDTESSNSLSIAVAEIKNSKSSCDKDEKSSSTMSSLIDENSSNQEESSFICINKESKEAEKQLESKKSITEEKSNAPGVNEQEKITNIIEEVDLVEDEPEISGVDNSKAEVNTAETKADSQNNMLTHHKVASQTVPISNADSNKVEESNEEGRMVVHKRRRRKKNSTFIVQEISINELQTENGVRQKRRSAKNAEEMIRKEILKDDEDEDDSSDESGKLVPVNYKKFNLHAQPLSPPTLKRTIDEIDNVSESVTLKRIKSGTDLLPVVVPQEKKEYSPMSKESIAEANDLVRKISQEDIRGKLKKLTPEELEALLLQKIVECITIRGEMGKLREQARASKRNQEATRAKCQQLQKQVEGFDMVLKRISYDKNTNADKFVPPIKINRSVGLQVNFLSQDSGIQNLKQIHALKATGGASPVGFSSVGGSKPGTPSSSSANPTPESRALTQSPRKMLKTRSPRRPEVPVTSIVSSSVASSSTTPASSSATPTALVVSKALESGTKRTITLQNAGGIVQLMPGQQQQTVVVNSTIGGTTSRPATLTIQRAANSTAGKTSDLIDLTDEEDKSKSSVVTPITSAVTTRFPRVLQAVPASVAITNPTNLRLVQAGGNQASQTAIVNNINTPRLAYVMQSGVSGVPTRQLVLTSSNTIRPVTSVPTRNIPTISYKQGVPTIANGTVRVLTTQAPTANAQATRHPAPLPEAPVPDANPMWKLSPPAPSLKISKVTTGIVLSWNMTLTDKHAEIVSYQLYAYQEVAGTSPSAALWKKVGDVRALPLPMACTLTQFTEGNNYYFAVRAVDIHSRFGQYSKPGNISL